MKDLTIEKDKFQITINAKFIIALTAFISYIL